MFGSAVIADMHGVAFALVARTHPGLLCNLDAQ
jgi:hypothetical protein